jgi:fructokinase
MLPRSSTQGENAFAPYAGGAVFNTAIALGRLGVSTGFFSGVSSDIFGKMLRKELEASNVDCRYLHISPRPTTLAFVQLDGGQASYMFYDENTAGRMLTEADLPALGSDIEAMLFGAISLISEPAGAAFEAFMRREHANRVMMLDPNIRPNFIPDRAKHLARIEAMMAMADIVKLSDEDLAWFGQTASPEDFVRSWLARGPGVIILTHGSKGATGYTRAGKVSVTPPPADVVDTVGAGDTFNAGVLASLCEQRLLTRSGIASLSGEHLRTALDMAARAAAVTVSRAGANPPWRRELG